MGASRSRLVLLFFVISLLCWAYAGSDIPLNVVNLLQSTLNLLDPARARRAGRLHVRAVAA